MYFIYLNALFRNDNIIIIQVLITFHRIEMANRGPAYGMSKEVQDKVRWLFNNCHNSTSQ